MDNHLNATRDYDLIARTSDSLTSLLLIEHAAQIHKIPIVWGTRKSWPERTTFTVKVKDYSIGNHPHFSKAFNPENLGIEPDLFDSVCKQISGESRYEPQIFEEMNQKNINYMAERLRGPIIENPKSMLGPQVDEDEVRRKVEQDPLFFKRCSDPVMTMLVGAHTAEVILNLLTKTPTYIPTVSVKKGECSFDSLNQ